MTTGPWSVCEQQYAPFTPAAAVQQLRVFEQRGLAQTRKIGRLSTCCVEPVALCVKQQWIGDCRSTWEHHLDRLGDPLDEPDENDQDRVGTVKGPPALRA
jgi:hypothetical protein